MGNVVNRVFDSSGPEGKVRGTPQQIIDKYNQLARDAQLSNDRVAAENFQQHAEHYTRLLSEAQREQEARREQQERENRERQAQRDRERQERQEQQQAHQAGEQPEIREQPPRPVASDVVDLGADDDSGLVETPESRSEPQPDAGEPKADKPKKPRAPRKPRKKPEAKAEEGGAAPSDTPDAAE